MDKKPELVFVPGCFDSFEGTQEELDSLIEEIKRMAESGELMEKAVSIDEIDEEMLDDLIEEDLTRKLQ